MEVPEAQWLKPYSWCVITVSAIETFFKSSGSLFIKTAYSTLSCLTVMIGLISSYIIIDGYVRWLKMNGTIIERKHRRNIEDTAILFFYFGAIGSSILALFYPFVGAKNISFSMAPLGVGFMLGAKRISASYNQPQNALFGNSIHASNRDNGHKNTHADDTIKK